MSRIVKAALAGTVFTMVSMSAFAADLPLRRVVVGTSGLALYEHDGTISGDEDIELPVRLDRVDDMLKSLVVLDAKGTLGGVSLPGREPLSQTFRGLPFSENDLASPVDLMNALRGAAVDAGGIKGRLMNVVAETETTEEGTITRHRISVLTPDGIKTALMENLDKVQFTDKKVQDQIGRALEALFTNRIKDQRTLTVSLHGAGERPVGLAYIQDAPLWKSSYRLVLPKDAKDGKAVLQGWAVLENTTGIDWKGVSVTLMSGSPVTYKQSLYESYYLPRPELPVKVMDRVMPRIDTGAVAPLRDEESLSRMGMLDEKKEMDKGARMNERAMMKTLNAPAAAPMEMAAMEGMADMAMPTAVAGGMAYNAAPTQMAMIATAAAAETASQMVFAFPHPIDLPAGNSLMIPFTSHELPAEKVWVYQPETNVQHPLAAVELKNDTDSGLPPGILTLYDRSANGLLHVGDADMPLVPKNEDRFISFALDTKTKIDMQAQDDRTLGLITISQGVLHQKTVWRNTTTYTVRGPEDEDRAIVIEQNRRPDWELLKPEGIAGEPETTATHHRLRLDVPAGKDRELKVTLQNEGEETIALVSCYPDDIRTRMEAMGQDIPRDLRKALEKVIEMRGAAFTFEQKINEIAQERQRIYEDQNRLRENIRSVGTGSTVGERYMKNLNEQEDKLDRLVAQEEDTRAAMVTAQQELADYVSGLEL